MLTKLTLHNFQKHRKLTLEFKSNITTIIGSTDVGKSAILRALRWACLNKPNGTSFIRDGASFTKVVLDVEENTIVRSRGTKNRYTLNDKVYTAFGNEVPPSIASALCVTDLNFQNQHDSPFWFTLSPGQISREMNSMVDMASMDATGAYIASKVRHNKARYEVLKEQQSKAIAKKKSLAWVAEASAEYEALEEKRKRVEHLAKEKARLRVLLARLQSIEDQKTEAVDVVTSGLPLAQLEKELLTIHETRRGLSNWIQNWRDVMKRIKASRNKLEELTTLQKTLEVPSKGKCPLCHQTLLPSS